MKLYNVTVNGYAQWTEVAAPSAFAARVKVRAYLAGTDAAITSLKATTGEPDWNLVENTEYFMEGCER